MEKIARDKLAVKILCVALALILWFYVSYQENPSMSKTVKNVPLAISGEQALKENGFSVYSVSEKSVDVRVTAKRLSLARLSNKTISAGINVSSIKEKGTYVIPATINSSVNSNATFYVKGKDITVVVEPIMQDTFKLEADFVSVQDPNIVLSSYEFSEDEIEISAPESVMKEIGSVKTEQIIPEKNDNNRNVRLAVYGKNGKLLEGAECNPAEVKVTFTFHEVKTVPVVLKTTSGATYALPSDITVKVHGSSERLSKVTQIETEEINLALFEQGSKVRIKLDLPKDLTPVNNSNEVEIVLSPDFYG